MALNVTDAAAEAMLNALTALLNVGGAGNLVIYSGTEPADSDTALSGNTVLINFVLAATAFGAATISGSSAVAAAAAITGVNAAATGTATFFRFLNHAGTAVAQGTVTATGGGGDLTLTTVSVIAGAPCTVTSFTLTHPE